MQVSFSDSAASETQRSNVIVVGIGDAQATNDPTATLVTYALGSCVAVVIHDGFAGVGGMLHFMLPDSNLDIAKAQRNPYLFADTGIPLLFRRAYALGADKKRITVTVAGGAQVMDVQETFAVGKRNCRMMRKLLWKAGVMIQAEHTGGSLSRTISLEVKSGKVSMRQAGMAEESLPLAAYGIRRTL